MPFKSKAQQRYMFAAEARGELPKGTAEHWAHATKDIKKLPEHVKKASAFVSGFDKIAGLGEAFKKIPSHHLDQAGLGLLATVPAYHMIQGVRKKKKEDVATGAAELGGLGLLSAAVKRSHG